LNFCLNLVRSWQVARLGKDDGRHPDNPWNGQTVPPVAPRVFGARDVRDKRRTEGTPEKQSAAEPSGNGSAAGQPDGQRCLFS